MTDKPNVDRGLLISYIEDLSSAYGDEDVLYALDRLTDYIDDGNLNESLTDDWTSVADQMPEANEICDLWTQKGCRYINHTHVAGNKWANSIGFMLNREIVTHWRPEQKGPGV